MAVLGSNGGVQTCASAWNASLPTKEHRGKEFKDCSPFLFLIDGDGCFWILVYLMLYITWSLLNACFSGCVVVVDGWWYPCGADEVFLTT